MPLYDYTCDSDGKIIEVRHKMSESPEVTCECGQRMRKLIGTPWLDQKAIPTRTGKDSL